MENTTTKAKLIAVEGGDAQGKFTQSTLLVQRLNELGYTAVRVEVPLKTGLFYDKIYAYLHDGRALTQPNRFQLMQICNRLSFQFGELRRLRKQYDYVVLDRWDLSSLVYGLATGVNPLVLLLNALMTEASLYVVMVDRECSKSNKDSYESDVALQLFVNRYYRVWAEEHNGKNAVLINVDKSVDITHCEIVDAIVRKIDEGAL
jgi:thymidylate kinase